MKELRLYTFFLFFLLLLFSSIIHFRLPRSSTFQHYPFFMLFLQLLSPEVCSTLLFSTKTFYIIYSHVLIYLNSFIHFRALQTLVLIVLSIFMGFQLYPLNAPFLLSDAEDFFSHKIYQYTFLAFHGAFFMLLPYSKIFPLGKIELFFFHFAYS